MDDIYTKIVQKYKRISGFLFHYLVFFFALIVALFIFQRIVAHASTINFFQTNDNLRMQENKLIGEFTQFLNQDIKDNNIQIYVLQGAFQTEQGFITSINNLITYKGFVVPRYFYMYNTIPIKGISYFSGSSYDISELENFMNNFVFTKKISNTKSFTRVQLPLTKTLVDDFNLSCLFENKISNNTCNHYLNDFFNRFFVYNVSMDYSGFTKIFDTIKNNSLQREQLCNGLSKYFLYTNDQSDIIKGFFGICGQTYEDTFKRTTLFIEIQKTLENQSFDKTSYKDTLINAYKLLSYQQQIYQDFLVNKVDSYKISSYLDFVKNLLQKNSIESFYKDEIYRYNNKYLALALEKIAYQTNVFSQNLGSSKVIPLLTMITTLNTGEPMLDFAGLVADIQNSSLIAQGNTLSGSAPNITQEEKIQKKLQNISYLSIEKQNISYTTIDIIGSLTFISPDKKEIIKAHIIMEYENDMFLVKNIELQNKPGINDVIKNLLLIQNFSIGELYSYISKNLVFYEQINAPITANTDVCPALNTIKDIVLVSCTNTMTILEKNTIRYEFTFKNGGIDNINISDKILENSIKTSYSTIIGNSYALIDTIQSIIAYQAPVAAREGTTNAIVVFEKIQKYLGTKANDIADKNGKILVDISLGGINFIVNYILQDNTLGPWYFKDILTNNKPYLIQNLNLVLDDEHQKAINSFVLDPLTAIQNTDLTAWQNYKEFMKP